MADSVSEQTKCLSRDGLSPLCESQTVLEDSGYAVKQVGRVLRRVHL